MGWFSQVNKIFPASKGEEAETRAQLEVFKAESEMYKNATDTVISELVNEVNALDVKVNSLTPVSTFPGRKLQHYTVVSVAWSGHANTLRTASVVPSIVVMMTC